MAMSKSAWYKLAKIAQHSAFSDMAYTMEVLALQRDQRINGNDLPHRVNYQMHQIVTPGDITSVANNLGNPEYLKQVDSALQKRVFSVTPKNTLGAVINSSRQSPAGKTPSPASPASPAAKTSPLASPSLATGKCSSGSPRVPVKSMSDLQVVIERRVPNPVADAAVSWDGTMPMISSAFRAPPVRRTDPEATMLLLPGQPRRIQRFSIPLLDRGSVLGVSLEIPRLSCPSQAPMTPTYIP